MVMCESAVAATSHVAVLPRPHRSAAPARFQGALDKHKGLLVAGVFLEPVV